MKAKYFQDTYIINAINTKNSSFFLFLFCLERFPMGRYLLIKGLRLHVGNGSSINVFSYPWIPRPLTFRPITAINGNIDVRVADFITQQREWDTNLVSNFICVEDRDLIITMPINHCNLHDFWLWHSDKRGTYNVKSGYKLFMH